MSDLKATPGPWQFYADLPSTEPNWHIVTNSSRMRVLANVHIEPGNETDLANAHLIAAAPDLYEALKEAQAMLADGIPRWKKEQMFKEVEILFEKIETTLAKARGDL